MAEQEPRWLSDAEMAAWLPLVFLPRDLPHTFRSVGEPATALLIVTPGGLDEYFAELHATTIRDTVSFHRARTRFDDDGNPISAAGRSWAGPLRTRPAPLA